MAAILQTTLVNASFWTEIMILWYKFHWRSIMVKIVIVAINGLAPNRHQGITWTSVNTLRPRQNGRHFADDSFKCIFLNENARISLKISLKFVPKVQINNFPALVQIMAWRQPGDKPLSEPMMVSLLTHICVTQPQWVNEVPWCHMVSLGHDELKHYPIVMKNASLKFIIFSNVLSKVCQKYRTYTEAAFLPLSPPAWPAARLAEPISL